MGNRGMDGEEGNQLAALEERIAYCFRQRALLERALTHRSFAHEQVKFAPQDNEALEFLGDAVLGFLVSAWLLERFPDYDEGKLSKLKAYLVSAENLEVHAQRIRLGESLRLNRGEEKTGGRLKRNLLVGAYEALLAAIYLDSGIDAARGFLRNAFAEVVSSISPEATEAMDYKTTLQERLQARGMTLPRYEVIAKHGPAHDRIFEVRVHINDEVIATGVGPRIKTAHQRAAQLALQKLDQTPTERVLCATVAEDRDDAPRAK